MRFLQPEIFLIGYSTIDMDALLAYLEASDNLEFMDTLAKAVAEKRQLGEILCSFYAKLCYKSLTLGQNANVSKIRDITENLKGCFDQNHGSVFEHFQLNFVIRNCSRVFTHELVRHRVGTAFSQESGRYCRLDDIGFVLPPELDTPEAREIVAHHVSKTEETVKKLEKILGVDDHGVSLDKKKKLTSAIRRIAPNGQTNEMGVSLNIRALRHTLVMRTNRAAEWEIRFVFDRIANIIEQKFPLMLYGLEFSYVEGLREYRPASKAAVD